MKWVIIIIILTLCYPICVLFHLKSMSLRWLLTLPHGWRPYFKSSTALVVAQGPEALHIFLYIQFCLFLSHILLLICESWVENLMYYELRSVLCVCWLLENLLRQVFTLGSKLWISFLTRLCRGHSLLCDWCESGELQSYKET